MDISTRRLKKLLIDAVNRYSPSYGEQPVTELFAEFLDNAGIDYRLQPVSAEDMEGRNNLIVRFGPQPPELLWVGHVDTVHLWHDQGYRARPDGDRLYGLGTADMKGGCAAVLEALVSLVEQGVSFRRGFCLALVVGEEEYGDGSEALLGEVWAPLTVIGEPSELLPCTAHNGYAEVRLVCRGKRAHAALPEEGANAIQALTDWMAAIPALVGDSPFGDQISVNPREIQGGSPAFVIADYCEALVDFHLPPEVDWNLLSVLIGQAKERISSDHTEVDLDLEQIYWAKGYALPEKDDRLFPLRKAFHTLGLAWQPGLFRSHSDANLLFPSGTLPVVCGPGSLTVAHRMEEWVSLAEVEMAARLYRNIIREVCL